MNIGINKYINIRINKYGMLRNGTVAVLTLFGVGILFGVNNMMIAFPIALTSTVLGRQNFWVKTFNKTTMVLCVDISIILAAFLSSINIYIGLFINFITIFLIMYCINSIYDPTFYKPFIMLYIFTQYASISLNELPLRILSIVFGVTIIIFASFIKKINEKSSVGNSIKVSLTLIRNSLNDIVKDESYDAEKNECTRVMRELAYKVYITRYKKYLTTEMGKVQFDIYLYIEYLNIYLDDLKKAFVKNEILENEMKRIIKILDNFIEYADGEISIELLEKFTLEFSEFDYENSRYLKEVKFILLGLMDKIKEVEELENKDINKVYEGWERSDIDMFKNSFKYYLNFKSIRFKFSIRMAITLTLVLFIGEFLGFYKVIWTIITIMSIMQPYYEDTVKKAKERILGNVLAILFTGIVINVVGNKIVTVGILIASLYLLYGFKEYYMISLFAAIASICIASLTYDINLLLVYRVGYVLLGVVLVLIANRYLFRYSITDGIGQLVSKVNNYTQKLVVDCIEIINSNKVDKIQELRNMIIHITLTSEKLYLRNKQYRSEEINNFIIINNSFIVNAGYKILITNKDELTVDNLLNEYKRQKRSVN